MVMTDDTWHLIRQYSAALQGFVGAENNKPILLTEEEVLDLGIEKHEIVVKYAVGDNVRIVTAP